MDVGQNGVTPSEQEVAFHSSHHRFVIHMGHGMYPVQSLLKQEALLCGKALVEAQEVGKVPPHSDFPCQGTSPRVVPDQGRQEGGLFPHQGDDKVCPRPGSRPVALQKVHEDAWAAAVRNRRVEVDRCGDLAALGCQEADVVLERVGRVGGVGGYHDVAGAACVFLGRCWGRVIGTEGSQPV